MGKAWKRVQHRKRIKARQEAAQVSDTEVVKEVKEVAPPPAPKKVEVELPKKEVKKSYRTKKKATTKKKAKK